MKLGITLLLSVLILSCSGSGDKTEKQVVEIMRNSRGFEEATNKLLEFELSKPNDLTKLFLAQLYNEQGQIDKSYIYIDQIESIKKLDDKFKLQYYLLNAKRLYSDRKFDEVKELILKIKKLDLKKEHIEVDFLEAEVRYLSSDDEAMEQYSQLWKSSPELFDEHHFKNFLSLLSKSSSDTDQGLEVIDYIESNRGYSTGLGTIEADIYEKNKNYTMSLISLFKELEYGLYYNRVTREQIIKNLEGLKTDFVNKIDEEDQESLVKNINTILAFVKGDYEAALPELRSLLLENSDNRFLFYLYTSCQIMNGGFADIDLKNYLAIEQQFITHPAYYWRLVEVLKYDSDNYDFNKANKFLEKIIMLNPGTKEAKEARSELISLLNLDCSAEDFYLPDEIMFYIKNSMADYSDIYIEPINKMLSLPSNYYNDRIVILIGAFSKDYTNFQKKLENDKKLLSIPAADRLKRAGII